MGRCLSRYLNFFIIAFTTNFKCDVVRLLLTQRTPAAIIFTWLKPFHRIIQREIPLAAVTVCFGSGLGGISSASDVSVYFQTPL